MNDNSGTFAGATGIVKKAFVASTTVTKRAWLRCAKTAFKGVAAHTGAWLEALRSLASKSKRSFPELFLETRIAFKIGE